MSTLSVPRAEWYRFFDGFSRRHCGNLVDITVVGAKIGAQHEVRGLPLNGFVADRFGRKISIILGSSEAPNVDHPVDQPARVWVELDELGAEIALAIESENGAQTILELRMGSAPRPR